ncbi:hypothetical protein BV22DRAFT_1036393 [Leucogyrophana mollusca]|uniref:Uncharacterized protein n=1 Tax=Leucogyrophana mollusca TaxID=85980 RepID=A0ACB8BCD7_9AGAM|nr:hypothetical protein BV22DRAFT_1036393 [Leucogyrophana mollusca]
MKQVEVEVMSSLRAGNQVYSWLGGLPANSPHVCHSAQVYVVCKFGRDLSASMIFAIRQIDPIYHLVDKCTRLFRRDLPESRGSRSRATNGTVPVRWLQMGPPFPSKMQGRSRLDRPIARPDTSRSTSGCQYWSPDVSAAGASFPKVALTPRMVSGGKDNFHKNICAHKGHNLTHGG